ncbi:MAG: DNA polymerase [Gammaproteobacteria bacterium]|nr:DNA polymerase [Gammaproteobacteria bacterium]
MQGCVWDIESTNLLDESSIDYTASPYKLKESFALHCIVVVDRDTKEVYAFYDGDDIVLDGRKYETEVEGNVYVLENYTPVEYTRYNLEDFPSFVEENMENCEIIAHNQINYDLLTCKLYYGMDYTVEEDSWMGNKVDFVDTLVLSKTLNPDRFGGHSLDNLSSKTGVQKVEFRKHIPQAERFKHFAPDMLYYNVYDCLSNLEVYHYLKTEAEGWNWEDAISLEKSVADIITRQSHRGFKFNKELAEESIRELDALMEERKNRVEPLLPKKKATKAFMKDYIPPKVQFKKDGTHSANLIKWIEKHNGRFVDNYTVEVLGEVRTLPLPLEPMVTEVAATIDDSTHIKEWLVSLGWSPTEWKEKDLSVDTKKQKLPRDKFEATVDRYVQQTLESSLCEHRCEYLETSSEKLRGKLLSSREGKPVRVQTNPSFTVGQEKELCPDLERVAEDFPYVKDVVEYLTYKHRRNSILGGGLDWDEEEEAEKGYLAAVREDGRIPTPADTCGAATSRMKHRLVANIPRVTSLYGEKMRALFGVEDGFFQIGYDFDSLEAREEAHYCFRYENEPREYCNSLLQDKPYDVHTMMAQRISEILKREFTRTPAKSVKYAATYGAQAAKIAKTIGADIKTGEVVFKAFWEAAKPLAQLKEKLKQYWEKRGGKKFILGIDGRKIPTRSPHAILNSLFQSAGVICAKRAMVIHDRLLKEHGLSVDFFTEDWKSKLFAQQLIAYHDEAQMEVSKSLVKFKMFETEEEAQAFKDEQDVIWSDIKPSPKGGWYVAYSLPGELAVKAVTEAGHYYNLNVELTAGYMVERSWAGCH